MPWWLAPALIGAGASLVSNIAGRKSSAAGEQRMQDIINKYLLPEVKRSRQGAGAIENMFLSQIREPGALYEQAGTAARGYAAELFKPGGEVASLLSKAYGGSIGAGWAPEAAERSKRGILSSATTAVGQRFAQEAAGLEQTRIGALGGFTGQKMQSYYDLLTSLYTGQAGIESLKASNRQSNKWLGLF